MENSIFSPTYWRNALGEVKKLRQLTFAALICALSIVVGGFFITVGDNLRIYFTFFITAVGCAVYGPVLGVMVAAVTDTLNYIIFPTGAYFPGYLLSEMAGALIYSLLLYRKKITVVRLFGAKFLVNYLVNVTLGCRQLLQKRGGLSPARLPQMQKVYRQIQHPALRTDPVSHMQFLPKAVLPDDF